MGEQSRGTENLLEGCSEWYVVTEAECDNDLNDLEKLFDESDSDTDISELIDNDEVDQGNSLALFNEHVFQDSAKQLSYLKRKLISPCSKDAVLELSPRLESVSLSPQNRASKKRLFEDSGYEAEDSVEVKVVGENVKEQPVTENDTIPVVEKETAQSHNGGSISELLLRSSNQKATALAKFKEHFGVGYNELIRNYKSDRTCCSNWVIVAFGVIDELFESSKLLLQPHCTFVQTICTNLGPTVVAMYLCEFKCTKNRDCLLKLMMELLQLEKYCFLADPPRLRSTMTALYFYKQSMSNVSTVFGAFPEWIAKQTQVNHQSEAEAFELSKMIQWALDNNMSEEGQIAYEYASIAHEDDNAAAWLKSNAQLKYLKDCTQMVRNYKRYEMKQMSMSEWIAKCCREVTEEGDWKEIARFLKYQEINMIAFLTAMRSMLKCIPKRQCLVFVGPPDTGKSLLSFSLIRFLQGRVISFVNSRSQFWLSPLAECKIALLDDATDACWQYFDINMRTAIDGNPFCIDFKHKTPMQMKLPPLIITSNQDISTDEQYKYLKSRVTIFKFNRTMPLDTFKNPVYKFTDAMWKSFFVKLEKQLDLSLESEDGEVDRAIRVNTREAATNL